MSKSLSTPDQILACARGLIVAGGYNGFSYANIAEVVGIRKASIHHHFPAKADLVRALVVQHRQNTEAGVGKLQAAIGDPLELLRAYAKYWQSCIEDMSVPFCVCALLAGELPVLPEEVVVEVRAYFRFLSGWIAAVFEQGQQQGAISLSNAAKTEAEAFMAMLHGAMLSARAYGSADVFATVTEAHLARLTTAVSHTV